VQIINETQAIAFLVHPRMYLLSYPSLTVTEYNPGSTSPITGVTSVAISTEIPGSRSLGTTLAAVCSPTFDGDSLTTEHVGLTSIATPPNPIRADFPV
jgi:hypothetical protein